MVRWACTLCGERHTAAEPFCERWRLVAVVQALQGQVGELQDELLTLRAQVAK